MMHASWVDSLSKVEELALLLATIEIASRQSVTYDRAAAEALDALWEVRQAQKEWSPPPGYRSQNLPRDAVDQLIAYVQNDAGMPLCDLATCTVAEPLCPAQTARALLDRLNIPWQSDD